MDYFKYLSGSRFMCYKRRCRIGILYLDAVILWTGGGVGTPLANRLCVRTRVAPQSKDEGFIPPTPQRVMRVDWKFLFSKASKSPELYQIASRFYVATNVSRQHCPQTLFP